MAGKEAQSESPTQERRRLEKDIRKQVKQVLKSECGERSEDEDGVITVILNTEINPNDGKQVQLRIEDYPKALGNYTFVSKLLGKDKEPDGFIIINKKTDAIAGREEPVGIDTLHEYLNLLSASNNHHNPQPPPPRV